jgi:hypothetical protein
MPSRTKLSEVLATGSDRALNRLMKKRCRELGITVEEALAKHIRLQPVSVIFPHEAHKLREVLQDYAAFLGIPYE